MRIKIFFWITLVLFVSQYFIFGRICSGETKKVLMVIADKDFRDEEFKVPFDSLKKEGYEVVVASTALSPAVGMLGMTVEPDVLLMAAKPLDYDAVVFVGGLGISKLWEDTNAQELAKSMYKDGKLVAAICLAPVILANAGILEGKRATVWKSESHRLEFKGAKYTGSSVEKDGNLITADGPMSSEEFAKAIIEKLKE